VHSPQDWSIDLDPIWTWLRGQKSASAFRAADKLPWQANGSPGRPEPHQALVAAPILDVASSQPVGGVYLELHSLAQPWDLGSLESLFPAALSLAAQVASAFHGASVYQQTLAYQKVTQELALAGKIQASFLPDVLPRLNGWQLAVTLLPARETSGDFFDLISLSDRKLGLLIADVTDKGVGAALYMALSRTLIRTYAVEFDEDPQPDVVLFAANGRILKDARADLFVTVFYGILDLETGSLTYANAGHNPPYLLRSKNGPGAPVVEPLPPTGMPVGIEEDTVWGQETVQLEPGDVLVLYTDGIPDSLNSQGEFFRDDLLLEAVTGSQGRQANEIQDAILERVQEFVGAAPQFDDITLMILTRDAPSPPGI
jgi:sigma-B regulation protein RsbU (phosphoserine phosphatase)